MSAAASPLDRLRQHRPEWDPWLRVVEAMHSEIATGAWDAVVPVVDTGSRMAQPILGHASLEIDEKLVRLAFDRLTGAAQSAGIDVSSVLTQLANSVGLSELFTAAVCEDRVFVARIVGEEQANKVAPALALVAVPLLHASRRRYQAERGAWAGAYCPICAAWPAFVEVRGIERSRHARCGRCGAAWHTQLLKCLYCEMSEHGQLVTLVPQQGTATGAIEACSACGKYTKSLTTLQGCAPQSVYVEDLATVDLDIAALDAGYMRPEGLAYPLAVTAHLRPATGRYFRWPTS